MLLPFSPSSLSRIVFHRLSRFGAASDRSKIFRTAAPEPFSTAAASKYDELVLTDEGVLIHQSDPSASSPGPGLVWGSVLWPSGTCLAKFLSYNRYRRRSRPGSGVGERLFDPTDARVLDLGCGTGVVGLTCAKLGARHVSLSDSATELYPILRKSIDANGFSDRVDVRNLDWRDVSTFAELSSTNEEAAAEGRRKRGRRWRYDLIVAADVLYAGMDGLFARALGAHIPSWEELDCAASGSSSDDADDDCSVEALIACPNRKDSPLLRFFGFCERLGLALDRLEDDQGRAVGASSGTDAVEAFAGSSFMALGCDADGEGRDRWAAVAERTTFSAHNKDEIQIFRVRRIRGKADDARQIRRIGLFQRKL